MNRDQSNFVEYIVLEVTANAAADLMGIEVNTTALFYCQYNGIPAKSLKFYEKTVFNVYL